MRYSLILITTLTVALTGCAQRSDRIAPAYVSTFSYKSYSCNQLKNEAERLSRDLSHYAAIQDTIAKRDEALAGPPSWVLGLPVFYLSGGNADTADEISLIKGEMRAVEQVSITKDCPKVQVIDVKGF